MPLDVDAKEQLKRRPVYARYLFLSFRAFCVCVFNCFCFFKILFQFQQREGTQMHLGYAKTDSNMSAQYLVAEENSRYVH